MKLERVLVTGGAGFIGSHLVDAYVREGARVTIVDDLSTGLRSNVNPDAELIVADLRDPDVLRLIETRRFDLISHHAAQVDVRKSVADAAADAGINIVATVGLFQRAAEHGVRKVVFASSGGAIYGEPRHVPQREDHPFEPLSPYGCAKLSVEFYLQCFAATLGLHSVALRYANVYGPRQNSHGEAGVVAIFADRILRGEPVTIHGSGEQTRDFVFVDDVVRANMAASTLPLEGAFNVGTGVETSVNTLCRLMIESGGRQGIEVHHGPAKLGEQMRSVLDASKLRSAAQMPPPVALAGGLARTMEWFRERMGR